MMPGSTDQATPEQPTRLEQALKLAAAGYHLAPVTIRRNPATGKKMPIYHGKWRDLSTNDPDLIRRWAVELGDAISWCVDCHKSGIVVVDLDISDSYDAVMWWAGRALPLGSMVVDTASGGMHLYFRAHPDRQVGNTRGDIAAGVDTRGVGGHVYAPGSIVVGETDAGWQLRDHLIPAAELDVLPVEVLSLLDAGSHGGEHRPRTRDDWVSGAVHDRDWVIETCAKQLERVKAHPPVVGTGFRSVLMGAGMVLGRAVAADIVTRDYAEQRLLEMTEQVWGQADPDDYQWVRDGLSDGEADPWTVVEPGDPPVASVEPNPEGAAEAAADPLDAEELYRRQLQDRVKDERLRRDARRLLALEDRQPLQVLSFGEFLDAPQVDYLIDDMLWTVGTSRIFGPPGETKSFLALDLALSLATGSRWVIGDQAEREPVVVHYVMAEGQAVNTARALAWLRHHQVDRDRAADTFRAIPQGVLLTPEGIEQYLEHVVADKPALILLDTKHRMMVGDENSAADVAVLVRTLDALKEAATGHVCVIDHTGLGDKDRARGSSAVLGAMDTEVKVTLDRDTGIATAEVTRDKAAAAGRSWSYRLQREDGGGAVIVPVAGSISGRFAPAGRWFDMDQPPVPENIARLAGRGADAAKDVYRVLAFVNDPDGLTSAQIKQALDEGPRKHPKSTFLAGLKVLKDQQIVRAGATDSRIALALRLVQKP